MRVKKEITVFLIDDDAMYLNALCHLISNIDPARIKLKTFNTGEDCLKELNLNPDIVILDYYLNSITPNALNGMEILKKIKERKSFVHVVLLSGKKRMTVEMFQEGAYDYVNKFENISLVLKNIIDDIVVNIEISQTLNESLGI